MSKRANHPVPIPPGGTLNDYIPFYFTPFSPMLKNIHSGWGGIKQRNNSEIVILVSSLHKLNKMNVSFIFTDSHAYYMCSNFYSDIADLGKIDWPIIQAKDFKRDPNDPAKFERYQAEALIHNHCPIKAFIGIVCYSAEDKQYLEELIEQSGHDVQVIARPKWYFS
ncbi:type II toxin-antitoxin system toxin DNA ADP-ribosyl transferase DarT [Xenorhabdus littoralis]|uniref:type II toxin-antitoxin system toxin DNA ADP-ribosyl transferase DarT n=1 Tax=Xenorhabdus littoralis TaxID=2582835 RepID=UPI003F6CD5B0